MSSNEQLPALDSNSLRLLSEVSTATVTTQLLKRGFRNMFIAGLTAYRPDMRLVGTAFTLRYVPAREDFDMSADYDNARNVQRLAVEAIGPGEVLVIDARMDLASASFGHILATRIANRGAAGLVTDGALRDTGRFGSLPMPSYARGAHATTSAIRHHPVDMNVPIGCAGVLVVPGDVVLGDSEGVAVIPRKLAAEVARDAYEQEQLEGWILGRVSSGATIRGNYPPDAATRHEYQEWLKGRQK